MSPEVAIKYYIKNSVFEYNNQISLKSDVFSLGLIFHYLLFGSFPKPYLLTKKLKERISNGEHPYCWEVLIENSKLKICKEIQDKNKDIGDLIKRMLNPDIDMRPTIYEVVDVINKELKCSSSFNDKVDCSNNIDLVICMDSTESMSPYLVDIKNHVNSFYQIIEDEFKDLDKEFGQFRIKIIAFRDYRVDDEPMKESDFFVIPEQKPELQSFLDSIYAKGGMESITGKSEPSNALEALALALKSDWTTRGARRRHLIVVFTDASASELGVGLDSPQYPDGMPSSLAELGAWWEGTDPSLSSTYERKSGRMVAFAPHAEPWIGMQSWNLYWPVFSEKCEVTEFDMECVMNLIFGS